MASDFLIKVRYYMHTLGSHFDVLFSNIRPPQNRIAAAKSYPQLVQDYLKANSDFTTVAPHARIVGSYAQRLTVSDVKDVDFLVVIDGNADKNEPEPRALLRGLKSVLDDLPESIGLSGFASEAIVIERARRSVHVHFLEEDFHLDVVPCIAPDGMGSSIWVPDHGFKTWIESNPLGVVRLVKELNDANYKKFRQMTKLLKHFRNYKMPTRQPKSYWLVAMAIAAVQEDKVDMSQPIACIFTELVSHLFNKYSPVYGRSDGATPNIPDPMLGHNVSWNWQRSHFETFMRRLEEVRDWSAGSLATNDRDEAIQIWQKIFGLDAFPTEIDDYTKSLAGRHQPGFSKVTSSGLVVPATFASKALEIPRTKFYGE